MSTKSKKSSKKTPVVREDVGTASSSVSTPAACSSASGGGAGCTSTGAPVPKPSPSATVTCKYAAAAAAASKSSSESNSSPSLPHTVSLQSNDARVFQVDLRIARHSRVINDLMTSLGLDTLDWLERPLPLPGVDGKTLEKVLEWVEHHKDDPEAEKYVKVKKIGPWDMDFLSCEQEMLFEIIKAANYLHIPKLLDTACLFVANMLKGKRPEEIRQLFNIKNDLGDVPDEEDFCEKCRVTRRRKGRGGRRSRPPNPK